MNVSLNEQRPPLSMSVLWLLACGAAIVTLSMGVRHGFGLWLQPVIQDTGWTRQDFSLALAVQNLAWGFLGVFVGMLADRIGAFKVLMGGALAYAFGLWGMAHSPTPLTFLLSAGVVLGLAQACTTYAVIYGVLGRQIPAEKRSWAMGVTAAAGSFGQFLMLPVEGYLIDRMGWQAALLVLAALVLLIVPLALGMREPNFGKKTLASLAAPAQTVQAAMKEALRYRSFQLLTAGYFVCGFQVVFIGVHMPSYLRDHGLPAHVATYALALIGLFNVFGTYVSGVLGQRIARRKILSFIYFSRAIVISVFLLAPLSAWSVYIFSAVMGALWLSTVPPTNATVAQIFGVRHFSMLSGMVFFSHQVGSFLGVWLGGFLYDLNGNYQAVWLLAIALGVLAGVINVPINERPLPRPLPTAPLAA